MKGDNVKYDTTTLSPEYIGFWVPPSKTWQHDHTIKWSTG